MTTTAYPAGTAPRSFGEVFRGYAASAQAREDLVVFSLVVLVHAILAYFLAIEWNVWKAEALARTASAQAVFWSRDPHLAAIGFSTNPLQSVLQLPLVLFRPLASSGLAGPIVSILAGGVGALFLLRAVRELGVPWRLSFVFLAAAVAAPMLLFYTANGMSESLFIAALWAVTYFFVREEYQPERFGTLSLLGLAVGVAFLARYEGVLVMLVLFLAVLFGEFFRRASQQKLEGITLMFLVVPLYVIFLWLLANWLTLGNPLYFLTGEFPNVAQRALLPPEVTAVIGQPVEVAKFVLAKIVALSLLFLILAPLLLVWGVARRNLLALVLLAIWSAVPLLTAFYLLIGQSFGATRSFLYVIPGGVAAAAFFFGATRTVDERGQASVGPGGVVLLLLVALSPLASWVGLAAPALQDERPFITALTQRIRPVANGDYYWLDPEIVPALDAIPGLILLDSYNNQGVILRVKEPAKLAIPSDRDFRQLLDNPTASVRYVLVPRPQGLGALDAINVRYPRLYSGGEAWATLVREFRESGYRLFRVRSST
ncbi:MAG: glycosyltransferase family 39 protein [Chloroflexi bacterium]|nr:glycosyltransferase family 39 protein [Chloroflexota bacterium]